MDKGLFRRAIPYLVLILTVIIFFWRVFFQGKVLLPGDILLQLPPWNYFKAGTSVWNSLLSDPVRLYYPWRHFAADVLKNGAIPLWNPYVFSGTPFLANTQAAIFYPLNVLFLIMSTAKAYTFQTVLHIFLAGLFMYLFMRGIEVDKAGALLASIVFMFSGFFIAWLEFASFLSTGIWIPMVFLFAELTIRKRGLLYAVLTALVLAISLFGGHIQVWYYLVIAFLLYFLLRVSWEYFKGEGKGFNRNKFLVRVALLLVLILTLTFALGAVQILPTFEFSKLIIRGKDSYQGLVSSAFPKRNIITFLVPDFFGNPVNNNFWGAGNYTEYNAYIGVLPLLLAMLALLFRRDKYTFIFTIMAAVSFLLALGTPLYRVLYVLMPGFKAFRAPGRFVYLTDFFLAALSGLAANNIRLAVESWSSGKVKRPSYIIPGAVGIVLAPLVVSALIVLRLVLNYRGRFSLLLSQTKVSSLLPFLEQRIGIFLLFFLLGLLILGLFLSQKISYGSFSCLAIGLVFLDLFIIGTKYNPALSANLLYKKTPSINYLVKDKELFRIVRFGEEALWSPMTPNTGMVYRISDVQGSDTFILERYVRFLSLMENQVDAANMNNVASLSKETSLRSPLLNLLNVKYIITMRDLSSSNKDLVLNKDTRVYRNNGYLPRAFLIAKAKVIKNEKQELEELGSSDFNPRDCVLLEESPHIRLEKDGHISMQDKAKIVRYSPNQVRVKTSSSQPTILFLSDAYYPGWKAYVDHKLTKIYRADYTFRAVSLDPGKHEVIFRFEPTSFRYGLFITAAALIAALVYFIGLVVLLTFGRLPREKL